MTTTIAREPKPICVCGHPRDGEGFDGHSHLDFVPATEDTWARQDYGMCWRVECTCEKFIEREEAKK